MLFLRYDSYYIVLIIVADGDWNVIPTTLTGKNNRKELEQKEWNSTKQIRNWNTIEFELIPDGNGIVKLAWQAKVFQWYHE